MFYFVIDVESIGLFGEGFAVGFCLMDTKTNDQMTGHYSCRPQTARGDDAGRLWVAENYPGPDAGQFNCENPREVRQQFWEFWTHTSRVYQLGEMMMAADVPWPVEARFLTGCIADDPMRKALAPYPLIDIASVRLAARLDPMETCQRKPDELPVHDPMRDAIQSARLLREALALIPKISVKVYSRPQPQG